MKEKEEHRSRSSAPLTRSLKGVDRDTLSDKRNHTTTEPEH